MKLALALSVTCASLAAIVATRTEVRGAEAPSATKPGLVVAVGGGGTPEAVVAHVAALAGGKDARVLGLPQASAPSP